MFVIVYAHHTQRASISHRVSFPQSIPISQDVYLQQYTHYIHTVYALYTTTHKIHPSHIMETYHTQGIPSQRRTQYVLHIRLDSSHTCGMLITQNLYHHAQCVPILHSIYTERIWVYALVHHFYVVYDYPEYSHYKYCTVITVKYNVLYVEVPPTTNPSHTQ